MKKLLLLAFVIISLKSFAIGETIKGNGVLKSEKRDASGYTSISSGGSISIDISYGKTSSIELEADENILPYIETFVKDNKLTIKIKNWTTVKPKNDIKVHVSMTTITGIDQSGSGAITGNAAFTNEGKTEFRMSGSGSIKLAFSKFESADIQMSGSGRMELSGSIPSELTIAQSGSGQIDCTNAATENVKARLAGSGNAKVNVTKSLEARVSGSGRIFYSGNPTVDSKVSGSGGVSKM